MNEEYTLTARLAALDDNFISTMRQGSDEMNNFKNNVEKNARQISTDLAIMGGALTAAFTVPMKKLYSQASDTFLEFEKQANRVQAIGNYIDEEADRLKDKSIEVGEVSAFDPIETLKAMEALASRAYTVDGIEASIEPVMNMAAISGGDLEASADAYATISIAYDLEHNIDNATMVSDMVAAIQANTASGAALTYDAFGAAARYANSDIELTEFGAIAGILADYDLGGSQGVNLLAGALSGIANANNKQQGILDQYNFNFFEEDGSMKSFLDILTMLEKGFEGVSTEEQKKALNTLFGRSGEKVFEPFLNAGSERFEQLHGEIKDSAGMAAEQADTILGSSEDLSRAMINFENTFTTTLLKIGEIINPIKAQVLNFLTTVLQWFNGLDEGTQKAILFIGTILGILGPVLLLTAGIMKMILFFKSFFAIIGIGAAAAGLALIKVIGIIILIGALIYALLKYGDTIGEFFKNLGSNILEFFTGVYENGKDRFAKFTDFIGSILDRIKELFGEFLQWSLGNWERLVEASEEGLGEFIRTLLAIYVEAYENIKEYLTNIYTTVIQWLKDFTAESYERLMKILSYIDDFFGNFFGMVKEGWSNILGYFTESKDEALDTINELIDTALGYLNKFTDDMRTIGRNLLTGLLDGMISGYDNLTTWLFGIGEDIKGIFTNLFNINSPSRWMRDEIGANLMKGLSIGIDDNVEGVVKSLYGVDDKMRGVSLGVSNLDDFTPNNPLDNIPDTEQRPDKKPMNINLNMNRNTYRAFVDDITEEQDKTADLDYLYA